MIFRPALKTEPSEASSLPKDEKTRRRRRRRKDIRDVPRQPPKLESWPPLLLALPGVVSGERSEWESSTAVRTSTKHESTWKVLERCRVKSTVQACCPVLYCCTLTYCAQLSPAHSPGHHNSSLALNSLRRSLTPLQRRRRSSYRTLLRCVSPHPPPSAWFNSASTHTRVVPFPLGLPCTTFPVFP